METVPIPVLDVQGLSLGFRQYDVGLRQRTVQVIKDLSISVRECEIMAVVGASGSGKSLLAHAILGILPNNAVADGSILYRGKKLSAERLKTLRGKELVLVPQSVTYLDPLMKVGDQLRTAINGDMTREEKESLIASTLEKFSLDPSVKNLYPFQLSGGMARRVLVCCSVIGGAKLIVADEPTPGLHHTAVMDTLEHLRALADGGCSVLLITHDINVSLQIADRIAVFYAGTILEIAGTAAFHGNGDGLRHPYSRALFRALPQNGFETIEGSQPTHYLDKKGCPFAARCEHRTVECETGDIPMREIENGLVRCVHA